jgi:hypothetical protein
LLKIASFLVVICMLAWFHFSSLASHLENYEHDLMTTSQDLKARRAGCVGALASAKEFEKHASGFLAERESEITKLKSQMEATRERIGDVDRIKEECGKLEQELAEVRRLLWLLPGREDSR